jgi:hypothetical protein
MAGGGWNKYGIQLDPEKKVHKASVNVESNRTAHNDRVHYRNDSLKSINRVTLFLAFELGFHSLSCNSSHSSSLLLMCACRSHSILPSTSQYSSNRVMHGEPLEYSHVICSGWYRFPVWETAHGPSMGCPQWGAAQRDLFASW